MVKAANSTKVAETTVVAPKPEKFTDMFFDNFVRTTLGIAVLIAAYMLAAKFGIELYVIGGLIISAVLSLILTFVELIRKKKVAPPA